MVWVHTQNFERREPMPYPAPTLLPFKSKFEYQISKYEINSNVQNVNAQNVLYFGICILILFWISCFGFRICGELFFISCDPLYGGEEGGVDVVFKGYFETL